MKKPVVAQTIITYLLPHHPVKIGIFGSFARGEENKSSDIDILIAFKKTVSLLELVKMERELSVLLKRKVDLVTDKSLKHPIIKKNIAKDLKIIYE